MVEQLPFVDADAFVSLCIRIVFSLCGLTVSAVNGHPTLASKVFYSHQALVPIVSGTQVDEVKTATRKNNNHKQICSLHMMDHIVYKSSNWR